MLPLAMTTRMVENTPGYSAATSGAGRPRGRGDAGRMWDRVSGAGWARQNFLCSFTFALVATITAVFFTSVSLGGFANTRQNPTLGTTACQMLRMGAKYAPFVIRKGEVWRLASSVVVSSGFFSFFVYILLTFVLVFPVELAFGTIPIFLVFWTSGILANLFSCTASVGIDTGAGGALMGIVGFRVASVILCWNDLDHEVRRRVGILEIFASVLLFFTGLSPNVDNAAHFAGFVCGSFLGSMFFAPQLDATPLSRTFTRILALTGLVFITTIWIVLVASREFGLIENLLLESICPPKPFAFDRLAVLGTPPPPDPANFNATADVGGP